MEFGRIGQRCSVGVVEHRAVAYWSYWCADVAACRVAVVVQRHHKGMDGHHKRIVPRLDGIPYCSTERTELCGAVQGPCSCAVASPCMEQHQHCRVRPQLGLFTQRRQHAACWHRLVGHIANGRRAASSGGHWHFCTHARCKLHFVDANRVHDVSGDAANVHSDESSIVGDGTGTWYFMGDSCSKTYKLRHVDWNRHEDAYAER